METARKYSQYPALNRRTAARGWRLLGSIASIQHWTGRTSLGKLFLTLYPGCCRNPEKYVTSDCRKTTHYFRDKNPILLAFVLILHFTKISSGLIYIPGFEAVCPLDVCVCPDHCWAKGEHSQNETSGKKITLII